MPRWTTNSISAIFASDSSSGRHVITAPRWLRDNFRNTGDKIGIDGGPWMYNGVRSQRVAAGRGTGKSVDDVLSVWVREISSPGPIRLGATEAKHDDLNRYGNVAVPLATAK